MNDFDAFKYSGAKQRAVQQALIQHGGFHLALPNDKEMEGRFGEYADVAMALLAEYHGWLSRQIG